MANFVDSSWETKLKEFIFKIVKSGQKKGISQKDLERSKRIAADISDVDVHSISVHSAYEQSWLEKMQSRVEQQTRTGWNWWPLKQPRQMLRRGNEYIIWKCVSYVSVL